MTTQRKRATRQKAKTKRANSTVTSDSYSIAATPAPSTTVPARTVLHECVGAICLIEVTLHSLESQELAFPEQEVLKRALKSVWSVHDWLDELKPDDMAGESTDREGKS